MRAWWEARSASERRWLSLGALVVGATAWYLLLIEPLHETRSLALTRVNAARVLHQELIELGDEARQLALHGDFHTAFDPAASILSVVNTTAASAGTQIYTKRINPLGSAAVTLFLDDVPFNRLGAWLVTLDSDYGVAVDRAVLERVRPGLVDAQLTVSARGLD